MCETLCSAPGRHIFKGKRYRTTRQYREITVRGTTFDAAWDLAVAQYGKAGLFLTNHVNPQPASLEQLNSPWPDEVRLELQSLGLWADQNH